MLPSARPCLPVCLRAGPVGGTGGGGGGAAAATAALQPERRSRRTRKGRHALPVSSGNTLGDLKMLIFQHLNVHPLNAWVSEAWVGWVGLVGALIASGTLTCTRSTPG